jgi:basic amino acid/polyamine antiporter, APA family
MAGSRTENVDRTTGFVRGLGLFDSVMMVAGSMIGSGIFIVSADIARKVGSAGWLLAVWAAAGALIVLAAASYGELAGMMPRVGGQYVYLKETYSPLCGFLFAWAMFVVIQSGTIAAVAVGFSRFFAVLVPGVEPDRWIVPPVHLSDGYALSLSTQQAVSIGLIVLLTWVNTRGLQAGKGIQNLFTAAKTLALLAVIALGLAAAPRLGVLGDNLADLWTPRAVTTTAAVSAALPPAAADAGGAGLLAAFCLAMVGALFSSGAWNDVSFAAGEVRDPARTLPRALILGTALVTGLYLLANLAYLAILPLSEIQNAPDDRVATAALEVLFGPAGATVMAVAIVISTFGCVNGLILAGSRLVYAMAKDGLFLSAAGRLNAARVPAVALVLQGICAAVLLLPRTVQRGEAGSDNAVRYGNLYSNLLESVIAPVLIFYALTIAGVFVLRRRRPDAPRPYRTFGYPVVPALYVVGALAVVVALLLYRTETTWPGILLILLTGLPVYFFASRRAGATPEPAGEAEAGG